MSSCICYREMNMPIKLIQCGRFAMNTEGRMVCLVLYFMRHALPFFDKSHQFKLCLEYSGSFSCRLMYGNHVINWVRPSIMLISAFYRQVSASTSSCMNDTNYILQRDALHSVSSRCRQLNLDSHIIHLVNEVVSIWYIIYNMCLKLWLM